MLMLTPKPYRDTVWAGKNPLGGKCTLVGLWDMIQFTAERFLAIGQRLATIVKGIEKASYREKPLSEKMKIYTKQQFSRTKEDCLTLAFGSCLAKIDRIERAIDSGMTYLELAIQCSDFYERLYDEAKTRLFMAIPKEKEGYFQDSLKKFGQNATDAFPTTIREIESAGKCYATGNHTACVFHLMRIMEVGLRAFGKSLKEPKLNPKNNPSWESILKRGDSELQKARKERTHQWKKHDLFFSQAHANLRAVKDAWRNPTMHVEIHYDEQETMDVFNMVSAFMRHLATKLQE